MSHATPGGRLTVKKSSELTTETRRDLERLDIDRSTVVYATYVDTRGVSIYVKRVGKSDIEGFIPHGGFTNWRSYFDAGALPGNGVRNAGYATERHFTTLFPSDCV
ncbi:MAG: hypothetical protein ACXWZS_09725 [Gemmatirosa sp.]